MRHDAIASLLPTSYQLADRPGSPLAGLLDVMSDLQAPDEALLAAIDSVFHPYQCPDPFVPWLTRWVGLDDVISPESETDPGAPVRYGPGLGRLRDLLAVGAALAQRKGTAGGLRLFLEAATGMRGFLVEEPRSQPFHVVVTAPAGAAAHADLLRRILASAKPAAVTYQLRFADAEPVSNPDIPDEEGSTP